MISEELKNVIENLKQLGDKRASIMEDLKKLGKKEMLAGFEHIFSLCPRLKAVTWTQYTPYFNDGDACYFSVHDLAGIMDDDEEIDSIAWGELDNILKEYGFDENSHKALCDIWDVATSLGDDFFKETFGDHSQITITRDGVEVVEYDHD